MPVIRDRDASFNTPGVSYSTAVSKYNGASTYSIGTLPAALKLRDAVQSVITTTVWSDTRRYNEFRYRLLYQENPVGNVRYTLVNDFIVDTEHVAYGGANLISNGIDITNRFELSHNRWPTTDGRALEKILESARGAHANLSVDFAEGMSTIAMLRKATKLRKLVFEFTRDVVKQRGYKKIRPGPSQGQRRLDYVTGKWLEGRYGWMPLISSLYDLVDAIRKERVSNPIFLKARSGAIDKRTQRLNVDSGGPWLGLGKAELEIASSYRTEIGAAFTLPSGYTFSDFTSLNPLLVAWELVPFSFIADWFVGVGQCLENWENYFLYRNRFLGGYRTNTLKEERKLSIIERTLMPDRWDLSGSKPVLANGYYKWYSSKHAKFTLKYLYRVPLLSLPTPTGPRVKANLQPKHFMDIASLVQQHVKRFRV